MCTKDALKQCTFWQLWFTIMFVSITNIFVSSFFKVVL